LEEEEAGSKRGRGLVVDRVVMEEVKLHPGEGLAAAEEVP
jgi:hypothetical protein